MRPRIVLVAGPTAVGKSALALALAEELGGEILSIDSVQVYRGLDIGSAKPTPEERGRIPHHLIDELDPHEDCNVADFAHRARAVIADIQSRGKAVIAVGGTNLYVRVLVHGIFDAPPPDPEIRARHQAVAAEQGVGHLHAELARIDPSLAARVHENDLVRISRGLEVYELTGKPLSEHQRDHAFRTPNVEALKIALNRPREELYRRIDHRVDAMMDAGFVEEVRALIARGVDPAAKPMQSLGYRHITSYLSGDVELEPAVSRLKRDTRRFAKQQLSWLRSEPDVAWARADVEPRIVAEDARAFLAGRVPDLRFTDASLASL